MAGRYAKIKSKRQGTAPFKFSIGDPVIPRVHIHVPRNEIPIPPCGIDYYTL